MKIRDYIFFAIVILCLFMIWGLVSYMKGEGGACLKNPYMYASKKMGNVTCSCQQELGECDAKFYFNDTSFDTPVNICKITGEYLFRGINLSATN